MTIRILEARAVNVPMRRPLRTSGATMMGTGPLVLIDLLPEEGVTACGYVFCSTPLATQAPHALQHPALARLPWRRGGRVDPCPDKKSPGSFDPVLFI
ncbi:MAG: hypothetical protein ACE5NA_11145 [Nitrospiraceae bacterium]